MPYPPREDKTMSLAALRNKGPAPKRCIIAAWANTLTDTERDALDGMLNDPTWGHKELAERITADDDYPDAAFTPDQIRKHRNGDCACDRPATGAAA